MSSYNDFPGQNSGLRARVVVGGHDGDPPKDHSSTHRLYDPLTMSPETSSISDLPFTPFAHSPSQFSQQSFQGGLDPGSIIYYISQLGFPGGIAISQANPIMNGGEGGSGADGGNDHIKKARQTKLKINTPPKVEEAEERGAKVRKVKESGEQHRLELLDGLPIHGALFDMAGFKLPQVKNVPTAKTHGSELPKENMLGSLQGQISTLGGMFQGLLSGGMGASPGGAGGGMGFSGGRGTQGTGQGGVNVSQKNVLDKLTPEMQLAVQNLSILVQGMETTGGVAFALGGVVHEETYLKNAEMLLGQVTCLSDLMYVLNRLQWDTSLFGQDKLDKLEVQLETAWGIALHQVDAEGTVNLTYTPEANNNLKVFELLTSNANSASAITTSPYTPTPSGGGGGGSGGGGGGGSGAQSIIGQMFGKSSGVMNDLMKRLSPGGEKASKKLTEKLSQGDPQQKLMEIAKQTMGGNPLNMLTLFSGGGGGG